MPAPFSEALHEPATTCYFPPLQSKEERLGIKEVRMEERRRVREEKGVGKVTSPKVGKQELRLHRGMLQGRLQGENRGSKEANLPLQLLG